MGVIARNSNAPIVDGEVASGADVESDFATLFAEVNGNLSAANLAAKAVTTTKLDDNAVTQAKMTSGAATASEAQVENGGTGYPFGTSDYTNIGTAITHAVGSPARHVIIMASWLAVFQAATTSILVQLLKDGTVLQAQTFTDRGENHEAAQVITNMSRMYIDTAPTAGGTHTYQLQMKAVGAAGGCYNLALVAFEPRS